MQGSLEKCIENYKNLSQSVGYDCNLKNVKTPFVDEDALDREANNFLKDQECKQCGSQFWQQWLSKELKKKKTKSSASECGGDKASPSVSTCDGGALAGSKCAGVGAESESDWDSNADSEDDESPARGALGPIVWKVLMQVLYTARMCRYDLLRATGRLATLVTKWTEECDRKLHRLMSYIASSLDVNLVAYVGDKIEDQFLRLFADSEFAGCKTSGRSTSEHTFRCRVLGPIARTQRSQRGMMRHRTILQRPR